MYARKDGGRFHFNPDPDKAKQLVDEGYEILDDDLKPIENPVEEAQKQHDANAMTGTIEDFVKYCKENNVSFFGI